MLEVVALYWTKIFVTLVVFVVLIIFFIRSGREQSSISGSILVRNELDLLNDNYTVFCNVNIPTERGMTQIPYVVVSPFGIFVMTCCYHVGKISGRESDQEWNIKNRGINETMTNPLWENRKHINDIEKKIDLELHYIPLIVFTYSKLVNDFGPAVVRVGRLRDFFASYEKTLVSQADQKSVINILKE
ncbi:MAG: NERD domain-containing protein [Nitrospina sp.]|nr:NERD domain-containing protein [Nitrospina sp.]